MAVRKPRRKPVQWERADQAAFVMWFRTQYPGELIFCIPNQLIRSKQQAVCMAQIGMVSGMPDICIPIPKKGFHGLYIELKANVETRDGHYCGGLDIKQANILRYLDSNGYLTLVSYGWDYARKRTKEYMEGL